MSLFQVGATVTALAFIGLVVGYFVRVVQGGSWLATAPLSFLVFQAIFLIGFVAAANWNSGFDTMYVGLVLLGFGAFVAGTAFASYLLRFSPRAEITRFRNAPVIDNVYGGRFAALGALAIVCVLVAAFYVARVGANAYLFGFHELLSTGGVDRGAFVNLRKSAGQSKYTAAGYAAQFTAVILPAVGYILYIRGRRLANRRMKATAFLLLLISAYSVSVVGGRKFLLQILLAFLLLLAASTSPFARGDRPARRTVSGLVLLFFLVYGTSTILQGRLAAGESPGKQAESVVFSAYNRVSGDYSSRQLTLMRALHAQAPVWGSQWAHSLKSVVPGSNGSAGPTFDAKLYEILFGNTRGNAPLNIWGSIYYNWGAIGLIALPFLLGASFQYFSVTYLIRRRKSLSQVVLYSLAGYRLALVHDPYSLLLEGAVTLMLLAWLERRLTEVLTVGESLRPPADQKAPGRALSVRSSHVSPPPEEST